MFLLIVVRGMLFANSVPGEIMREDKDSMGRKLLPEDAVYRIYTFSSSINIPSSLEDRFFINYG
jgi:hypothetical protein